MSRDKRSPGDEIIQRLDIIICLLLDRSAKELATNVTDKIAKLEHLGTSPAQIARILRKPANYVTASISMRKKVKTRG